MNRMQITLASTGFEKYSKTTRRAQFLAEMDRVVPWRELCARIEPVYPKAGNGRPPVGVERMLRMYFLQHWFNLSDPAVEEALYDSPTMRVFVGIDLGREPVPDETTVCKFRHLLEHHGLGRVLFDEVAQHLRAQGLTIRTGTIVDATIIAAPSSTKNATGRRDPEMHQTKKGQQWYFGMKAHLGVDSRSKLIHSIEATSANIHDSQVLPRLLHGRERRVWGDAAYTGQRAVLRVCAPHARDFTQRKAGRGGGAEPRGADDELVEVPGPGQGRASHRGAQARVRLHQGPLSGPRQEWASPRGGLCARELVHGAAGPAAPPRGVMHTAACRSSRREVVAELNPRFFAYRTCFESCSTLAPLTAR
jgi:IS5 family transposase